MTVEQPAKNVTFEKPAVYRIRVKGHVDDSLSDQLGSLPYLSIER